VTAPAARADIVELWLAMNNMEGFAGLESVRNSAMVSGWSAIRKLAQNTM
jgi:hypothetical protein